MTTFLVGKDKNWIRKRTTWDFFDALEASKNGDTIVLDSGYNCLFDDDIIIDKNITISGNIHNKKGKLLLDSFISPILVKNGANVTLNNLAMNMTNVDGTGLTIMESSNVNINTFLFKDYDESSNSKNIIKVQNNSNVNFNKLILSSKDDSKITYNFFVENSNVLIEDSEVNVALKVRNLSNLKIKNSDLECLMYYVIDASEKSVIDIENSRIKNYKSKYTTIKLNDTKFVSKDLIVDSINAELTSIIANNTAINEYISMNNSSITSDLLSIIGKNDEKINLCAYGNSKLNIDTLAFGRITDPNIRLENTIDYNVKTLVVLEFDNNRNSLAEDTNGNFIIKGQECDIEWFNDIKSTNSIDSSSNGIINSSEEIHGKYDISPFDKLDEMVGIKSVKYKIGEFIAVAQFNKKRADQGIKNSDVTLHSLFQGNPGTGKTTVARILGELLYDKGIIDNDNFVEVTRSDLVAEYVGQTATKTRNVLEKSLGGILFIDEAYTLSSGGTNDYGIESINEILKFMEDHRNDIVIIFAGYTDEMINFLNSNSGLKSRIPNIFDFEDYTVDELIEIGLKQLSNNEYKVDEKEYSHLVRNNLSKNNDNSNGRWIRNLNDTIIKKMAIRNAIEDGNDVINISSEDLKKSLIN
ncbi:AAA family ATPase [Fructilactobacillus frigidiflavus]|uniref:AAA family ATPase n=1 Tax=Fructilactobacillus frigidiflavus TaxID=3242688 RepID=UPI003757F852